MTEQRKPPAAPSGAHLLALFIDSVEEYAIFTLDAAGFIASWNRGAQRITGYPAEQILGRSFACLYPLEDISSERPRRELEQAAGSGRLDEDGWRVRRDGERFWANTVLAALLDESGKLCGFGIVLRDITQRQRLEDQLRQGQKMEAVGQLAGGVAHDFNNLLTIIGGYSSMLLATLPGGDPARAHVGEIRHAAERAAALTRQLLTFSRKHFAAPKELDLNSVVRDAEKMLGRLIGEDIGISMLLGEKLHPVKTDPAQLEQVIVNMVINAREAMPGGGRLTLETRNVALDAKHAPDSVPGKFVMLAIADTGRGMSAETRARIFEPFFTTKEPGKGTGLGLATVYGFVKQSQGHIVVDSEPGKGTTFKIYLPALQTKAAAARDAAPVMARDQETILLVEDEEGVRKLARLALESHGYTVLEAANGQEGLDVAKRASKPIHLVLTDVVMPEMSGAQLVQHLQRNHPRIRVLFMSGYADEAIVRHGIEAGADFLQKPFTPLVLAKRIRDVLDRAERG